MVKFVPTKSWSKFSFMFLAQFISYFLVVANTRAFTQGSYSWTALTDWLISAQTFTQALIMTKMFAKEDEGFHLGSFLGYTSGGCLGSLASIWVTLHVYGR